ncbi:ATP-binding domain-containing protein [Fundidesulfovibrio soli]|uniref:ATP-binding domain-containing protein n=1 Tax=Fundidesulfovibrio soli TaxID=2922716 RepID=UPI001FB03CFC|nr:ATP-binding domain-containing protein [Fundidesulfovibrio soli]
MGLSDETKKYLNVAADETLDAFDGVAKAASKKVEDNRGVSCGVVSPNTWNSTSANENLSRICSSLHSDYLKLKSEPAIARIVALDENGKHRTYYICRATPVTGLDVILASYNSPAGRMASLDVGEEYELPNGTLLEIVEKTRLRPRKRNGFWDSEDTVLETDEFGPLTIKSLRALASKAKELGVDVAEEGFDADLLGRLLAEERDESNVLEGLRRSVIEKMGLRDQPILDKYQDEIFRLPLNKNLLLLGPPGTGKTTTLIRRLGQKSDVEFLEEDEKRLVRGSGHPSRDPHEQSWIMFTPTDLLKIYLKEAFAREGVPASDRHIRTWAEFRREIGRNVFHILRTTNGGAFVLKENDEVLRKETIEDLIGWCDDFESWQKANFREELLSAAENLSKESEQSISSIGARLLEIINKVEKHDISDMFVAFVQVLDEIKSIESELKDETNKKLDETINLQLNRDHGLLDRLAEKLEEIQQAEGLSEESEEDDVEDEEFVTSGSKRANAVNAFKQALRAQARAFATKRSISLKTRNSQLLDWIGERSLSESDQATVGSKLVILNHVRKFKNPLNRYLRGVQSRYKIFRRLRRKEDVWYNPVEFHPNDLHPLELDVVIFSILTGASSMLKKALILREIDEPQWSSLSRVYALCKNQIYVDEATDFSPVQLSCMSKLTHPTLQSFFACGDFNQRLTTWGSRSIDNFKWIRSDIEVKEVNIAYRQSRQLNELAALIITTVNGDNNYVLPKLPEHVDAEGVRPVLLENATTYRKVSSWLAGRVGEVERLVQKLPSIAVFVESEEKVASLAEELNIVLEESNIQAVACPNGQVMGNDNDVRVFDIQHIKGLEFEAVFFVGVDLLAELHPDLFDKYLYVGTTRAATYLGITCERELPESIRSLRSQFVDRWEL